MDQSKLFKEKIQALCEQALIDHNTTSRDHPKVDGLAKGVIINNQKSFANVWLIEMTLRWMGTIVVVVGYGL